MSEYVSAKAARRAEEEKARRERKKYNITVTVVVACFVLVLIFVALFGSNLFYNRTTALEIGGEKFSVADFNYNYFSVYNSYYSNVYSTYGSSAELMSMFLPSSGKSFRDQAYLAGEDMTWADFFTESAIDRMKSQAMLCAAARAEGYELTQEDRDAIDETIEGLRASVVEGGYKNLNAYLNATYGKGMTEKVFRANMEREYIASGFAQSKSDSFTFTDQQIADNYTENAADFDFYRYRIYGFSGAAVTDDESTEEDETLSAEDAAAKAKEDADAYLAAVTDEQSFLDYAASLNTEDEDYDADSATLRTAQGSRVTETVREWLSDPARKAGDVEVVKSGDDASTTYYYVVYFLNRDNNRYDAVSGYYGLVAEDETEVTDVEEDKKASALEELNTARAKELKDTYDAMTEKGYDAFVKLMNESSDVIDESGDITMSGLYDIVEELADWLHDPARKEGDVDVVYVEGTGAFLVYYTGVDGVYGDLMSEADLRSDAYTAWEDEQLKNYETVDKQWEMGLATKISSLGG